ncbi:MAG: phage portal protein [Gammaproteobacteria bacterium]
MRVGPFEIQFHRKQHEQKSHDFWTAEDLAFSARLPRTSYPYGRDVRHGLDSNVIMSPVSWIMRTFSEAEPIVEARRNDRWQTVDGHRLTALLNQPNAFYDGDACFKALVISYCLDGNAYKIKRRNTIGDVIELWYAPHWMIEPKWPNDGTTFISHYEYRPGEGSTINLLPRDVVHLRFGLDPRNTRKGFSPLRPLLREIFTDEEASNFAAAVLRNQGFPGVVISPKEGMSQTREEAKGVKERFTQHFTGDRRGEPFVATRPTDISTFGFNAQQIQLTGLRDVSEERVCAMLGLPAAVVGFGAGLQQVKVGATMRELVRLARVNVINPMARSFGKSLTSQLLTDFVSQLRRFRMRFDMSDVSVFQEDETEREERILARVAGGVMQVADAQDELGIAVDESQRFYIRPSTMVAVPAGVEPVAPSDDGVPAAVAERMRGNGTGLEEE